MASKAVEICVVGSGYVGLVTGVCLADVGHKVVCVDKNKDKIKDLRQGIIPIYEPGLDELVKKNVAEKRLNFSTDLGSWAQKAEVIFIAVGTPTSRRGDGYADLSYVFEVAEELAPHLNDYKVVVNKSTVPVGTAEQVARIVKKNNPKSKFDVASNPEFLREGAAVDDFMDPDRVVIGVNSSKAKKVLQNVYDFVIQKDKPVFITDIRSAELIKYASNSFLATKISFINEMANLCERVGANIKDVATGMGLDRRIGDRFLKPGPGYGGSCFPKDVTALLRIAQENESPLRILEAVSEVNIAQKARMVKKIKEALGERLDKKTVLFLGLTFKPDTDDMRDAPSLTIIPALTEKGVTVLAHDPKGQKEARKSLPEEVEFIKDIYESSKKADAVVILTEWEDYNRLDFKKIKNNLKIPLLIDLRNMFNPKLMREMGYRYISIGR